MCIKEGFGGRARQVQSVSPRRLETARFDMLAEWCLFLFFRLIRTSESTLDRVHGLVEPAASNFSHAVRILKQGMVYLDKAGGLDALSSQLPEDVWKKGNTPTSSTFWKRPPNPPRRASTLPHANLLGELQVVPRRKNLRDMEGNECDPLTALQNCIATLSKEYDTYLPQAIGLAQAQDNLQDEISLMTKRAETLRMRLDTEGNGKVS